MCRKYLTLMIFVVIVVIGFVVFLLNSPCLGQDRRPYYQLPSSATRVEEQSRSASRSCTTKVKFNMTPNDVDALLASTLIKGRLSSTNTPRLIGGLDVLQSSTNWHISPNISHLSGEGNGSERNKLDEMFVYIDTSDNQSYVVYIVIKQNWL